MRLQFEYSVATVHRVPMTMDICSDIDEHLFRSKVYSEFQQSCSLNSDKVEQLLDLLLSACLRAEHGLFLVAFSNIATDAHDFSTPLFMAAFTAFLLLQA